MKEIDLKEVQSLITPRDKNSNKGSFGRLLIIAGSEKYPGAAALTVSGALRGGAGLVTLLGREKVFAKIFPLIPEAVLAPMERFNKKILENELMKSTAVVIGPGIGRGKEAFKTLKYVLSSYRGPLLLDADALNILSEKPKMLKTAVGTLVLTPHPGEMSRLSKKSILEIQSSREETAKEFALQNKLHLILKGNRTVVASSDGETFANTTGNAGMARGGSGDILSGLLGAFLAMGEDALSASKKAVFLHGLAGDIAAAEKTEHSMLPSDIIAAIPKAFKGITE